MPIQEMFLVRVSGAELVLYSPIVVNLNWAKKILVSGKNISVEQIDSGTSDWLTIKGFKDHEEARNAATFLIKEMLKDGWQHQNYEEYVDGHWFKKQS